MIKTCRVCVKPHLTLYTVTKALAGSCRQTGANEALMHQVPRDPRAEATDITVNSLEKVQERQNAHHPS